jgi:putative transposase
MPWKELSVSDQRRDFIALIDDQMSVAAACRAFGVSRPTGYKILDRYRAYGAIGLDDQPRAPGHCPHATSATVVEVVIALRNRHPTWGPRKIRAWLQNNEPSGSWPAASTIGCLLKDAGLVPARRFRSRSQSSGQPLTKAVDANEVWCADFKGQFAMTSGGLCYPLTITDSASRFLLRCQALSATRYDLAQPVFLSAFRQFGLPRVIRTDNGVPFSSTAIAGLSRLSVWWLKLGIRPERIQPGHPEQNGAHERMHRTLKAEATKPPAANLRTQQRSFNAFQQIYNEQRPHEAIGLVTPDTLYSRSLRAYPIRINPFEYPASMTVRQVRNNGCIRFRAAEIFLSEALIGEPIGMDPYDDTHIALYLATMPFAFLNAMTLTILTQRKADKMLKELQYENQLKNPKV